ncbi:MAG: hypothetical protein ACFCVD_10790 [Nodosilinea sp.]
MGRWGILTVLLAWVSLCAMALSQPSPALAATWHAVAEVAQQQQFVDVDSIQTSGQGRVQVSSYYLDKRSGEPQRTTYRTEYDCDRRRFRDVEYSGPVGNSTWSPVDPDPLNTAAMEYVCAVAKSLGKP